jgi:kynureninase
MSKSSVSAIDRDYAVQLDANDSLAQYKSRFYIADLNQCYLDGNSLGRMPVATQTIINQFLQDEWATQLVEGWNTWIDEAQSVGDLIGRAALGAAPGQTLAIDTTSVNFYQLCHAAITARPGRRTVISDTSNFPTDRYILEGLCRDLGCNLVLIDDSDGHEYVTAEKLAQHLNDDVALVTLSVIQYRSGALHDIPRLTSLAREAGALFVWDASHAVGVVPMKFDADGVDLCVGCTYKYGNSGPGSPGWMYVSTAIQQELQVPIQGWFAQNDQFAMAQGFDRSPTIRGFQIASPSVIGLRCIQSAFSMIEEATLSEIAMKAATGTKLMFELFDHWLQPLGCSVITPREAQQRGGHITISHPEARRISIALREQANVIADYRQPDCIRLAISPLATSYSEVWDGFDRLRNIISTKSYEQVVVSGSRVT